MAFESLHKDVNFNFQLNRVLSYGDEGCNREEVLELAKSVGDFDGWYGKWKELAGKARREERYMHSMYYYRMAEFFLMDSDPRKDEMYQSMQQMFIMARPDVEKVEVSFKASSLPCIVMKSKGEKGELLVHGGYDSFIEEFYLICRAFVEAGYSVILFEGEGQGATLRSGMRFNYKWEDSVGCILDYFGLDECSTIGISWGGYFALRAAAKDKRIKNVVAYDILYDGLDVQFNLLEDNARRIMEVLYSLKWKGAINMLVGNAKRKSSLVSWGIEHGLYITGTKTPYEFFKSIEKHSLKAAVEEIDQNVLLLAGENDHYIPRSHFEILKKALVNANVKSRLFLESEGGGQHCQVGNYDIAIEAIIEWLNEVIDK